MPTYALPYMANAGGSVIKALGYSSEGCEFKPHQDQLYDYGPLTL